MSKPDPENLAIAIERAEGVVRRLRTGEIGGFVMAATGPDETCFTIIGGQVSLTQTVCLLEHLKAVTLEAWMERFTDDDGPTGLIVADDGDNDDNDE